MEEEKLVQDQLKLNCDKQLIQNKIIRESNKKITTEDIHNIAQKLKNIDDDSLQATEFFTKK